MNFTDEKRIAAYKAYQSVLEFKESIGKKGLYTQNKINERFFRGDQWHGANCGNLPLVRQNVIKRIGEYKISNIASSPISVQYSAEGVPNTLDISNSNAEKMKQAAEGQDPYNPEELNGMPENDEISFLMDALSSYFKITCERLKFDEVKAEALKDAYISGTAILYTYWDQNIKTGLYADEDRQSAITGDIGVELIDVENFYPEDPNNPDLQAQDSIIITQRKTVAEIKRIAKQNGMPASEIENIKSDDDTNYSAGDLSETEVTDLKKATLFTKFYKSFDDGEAKIFAVQFTKGATVRDEFDTRLSKYPLCILRWENRKGCIFGDSEVTYLVPNQIAINRMLSASVWAAIMLGMPITVVNGLLVDGGAKSISNEPGQILSVNTDGDLRNVISYISPPATTGEYLNAQQNLIDNTLNNAGANDAALGNMRPDNTSAIIAVREAAQQPLQTIQNKFYQFCEDISRVWAEYWLKYYGNRSIKMVDDNGMWYLPINADRYEGLLISAKIDVGPSSLWSEVQTISTLDALFERGVLTVVQYLERLPKGYVPELTKLIEEIKEQQVLQQELEALAANAQNGSTPEGTDGAPDETLPPEGAETLPPEDGTAAEYNEYGEV